MKYINYWNNKKNLKIFGTKIKDVGQGFTEYQEWEQKQEVRNKMKELIQKLKNQEQILYHVK